MKIKISIFIFFVFTSVYGFAQKTKRVKYKHIDTTELIMDVYYPDSYPSKTNLPAMVFFFGGGWNTGAVGQFEHHARYFSKRGLVCFLVDYRTYKKQKTTPFESLKDAKSAMRYIRGHAKEFHINPDQIVASGGSAGGHLAAATAFSKLYNEETDDRSISCIPNALVLFNPVVDNGPGGYGYERIGEAYKEFSPLHIIHKGAPPTIFLVGTQDHLIPVETAKYYQKVMEKVGSRCDLKLYEGEKHGFFNYKNDAKIYRQTIYDADEFLISSGFLTGKPTIALRQTQVNPHQ